MDLELGVQNLRGGEKGRGRRIGRGGERGEGEGRGKRIMGERGEVGGEERGEKGSRNGFIIFLNLQQKIRILIYKYITKTTVHVLSPEQTLDHTHSTPSLTLH